MSQEDTVWLLHRTSTDSLNLGCSLSRASLFPSLTGSSVLELKHESFVSEYLQVTRDTGNSLCSLRRTGSLLETVTGRKEFMRVLELQWIFLIVI